MSERRLITLGSAQPQQQQQLINDINKETVNNDSELSDDDGQCLNECSWSSQQRSPVTDTLYLSDGDSDSDCHDDDDDDDDDDDAVIKRYVFLSGCLYLYSSKLCMLLFHELKLDLKAA